MADLSRRSLIRQLPAMTLGLSATGLLLGAEPSKTQPAAAGSKTLYDRLGGYDAISAVVEDFAGRLFTDVKIKMFFAE